MERINMIKNSINRLYSNFSYPGFFFSNFGSLDIPFNKDWKKVAVNLSGGADSALLAYILCFIIEKNKLNCTVDVISFIRCWNTRPWQQYVSLGVYTYLKSRFPKIINERHVTYIPPEIEYGNIGASIITKHYNEPLAGDAIIISSYNTYIAHNKNLDAVYNGITSNPDKIVNVPGRTFTEDQFTIDELLIHKKSIKSFLLRPFKYIQKDWVLQQYIDLNILELYNITRSCEGDITTHEIMHSAVPDVNSYIDGMEVPICNECDWCKERQWAEQQVGLANDK